MLKLTALAAGAAKPEHTFLCSLGMYVNCWNNKKKLLICAAALLETLEIM